MSCPAAKLTGTAGHDQCNARSNDNVVPRVGGYGVQDGRWAQVLMNSVRSARDISICAPDARQLNSLPVCLSVCLSIFLLAGLRACLSSRLADDGMQSSSGVFGSSWDNQQSWGQ